LLQKLAEQETQGLFSLSIIVVDNDHLQSAKALVMEFATRSSVPVSYCLEPKQNIARARNKAVDNCPGDFVAFIDDDELPIPSWLVTLFKACHEYRADGILGPVKPVFDDKAPDWIIKSGLYNRRNYHTGLVIDGRKGRTGNVLLKKEIFNLHEQWFRPEFRTGEDQDFFTRMIERGHKFVWCAEAVAYEIVPPIRWSRSFLLKRALLRGTNALTQSNSNAMSITKSFIAVPIYVAALPFTLMLGQHRLMTCLVKLCNHLGKLMALVGINLIKEPYVTE
jgi:glycosyltransferase involved in cell wall biosynthesis